MKTSNRRYWRPSSVWLVLSSGVLAACSAGTEPDGETAGDPERGSAVYAEYCALCHGERGEGYAADNANQLANQGFLATASDELLFNGIVAGRPGTSMSPFGQSYGGPLDDEQAADLLAFIRGWQSVDALDLGTGESTGSALRGDSVYRARCASCHGEQGQGNTAMSLNNPQFLADASDAFIRHAIAEGRADTEMPGYATELTSQAIDDLVVLIRSWQQPADGPGEVVIEQDLTRALLNPHGSDPSFELREGRFVPVDAVKTALDAGERMVIIDARPPSDYVVSHIPGAVSVPFYEANTAVDLLPRDAWNLAYCGCPHAASGQVVDTLRAAGYERSAVLDEGFFVWVQRGYPVAEGFEP